MADASVDKKTKEVKAYFNTVIGGYLLNDIQTLLNSDLDEREQGGCAAPLAMAIFSGMNQLGYLTSAKGTKEILEDGATATETCIKEFCHDWMAKVETIYNKSSVQEMMVSLFRHGMAHSFLSVYRTGITRHPKHKKLINVIEFGNGEKLYVLQAKVLGRDFVEAARLLERKIDKAQETDHDFIERFYDRLHLQIEKYFSKNVLVFDKAERHPEIAVTYSASSSTTTTISGTKSAAEDSDTSITVDKSFDTSG